MMISDLKAGDFVRDHNGVSQVYGINLSSSGGIAILLKTENGCVWGLESSFDHGIVLDRIELTKVERIMLGFD